MALADDLVQAAIIRGDARTLPLADDSVDLIVTSPPYYGLRSYTDCGEHYDGQIGAEPTPGEYIDALIDCTREWMRVLKPSGSLFVNLGDKYSDRQGPQGVTGQRAGRAQAATYERRTAAVGFRPKSLIGLPWRYALRCIDDLALTLRAEVVWSKPNGMPESVTDRVRRSHETWFHLTLRPRYYADVDDIREVCTAPDRARGLSLGLRDGSANPVHPRHTFSSTANLLGKLPGSVWEIATRPLTVPDHISHARCCDGCKRAGCTDGVDHFAAFPMEWPRRLIRGWCPPAGTVLDPFGGTGTTALVASMLGRRGISVDMSADYCRLAQWRCTDPGERAKAAQVDKPPVEVPGQVGLFGEAS